MIRRRSARPVPRRIVCALHIGRPLYWDVTEDGVLERTLDEVKNMSAISFDQFDYRIRTARPVPNQIAKRAFLRECGEATRIVNRSWRTRRLYGRPVAQTDGAGMRIGPGLMCLDLALAAAGHDAVNRVAGFVLGAESPGARRLALLYAFDAAGDIVRFQPAINPDNLDLVVGELARSSGMEACARPAVLFNQRELLAAAAHLVSYPTASDWNGIPIRRMQQALVGMLGAGTLAAGAYDVHALVTLYRANERTAELAGDTGRVVAENEAALLAGLGRFTREVSIPYRELIDDAQRLWMPGGRVSLVSDQGRDELALTLVPDGFDPLTGVSGELRRVPVSPERLAGALDTVAPPGFALRDRAANGDGNAIRIRFERQRQSLGLERIARH